MSEKKERTLVEIQQQYGNVCASAGQLQYQISILSDDIDAKHAELVKLNGQLKDLAVEANSVIQKEKEAKS